MLILSYFKFTLHFRCSFFVKTFFSKYELGSRYLFYPTIYFNHFWKISQIAIVDGVSWMTVLAEVCDFWNFHIIMRRCSIIKLQSYQNKSIHQKLFTSGCLMKFPSVLGWNIEKHWSLPLFTNTLVCRDRWNFHAGIFLICSTRM